MGWVPKSKKLVFRNSKTYTSDKVTGAGKDTEADQGILRRFEKGISIFIHPQAEYFTLRCRTDFSKIYLYTVQKLSCTLDSRVYYPTNTDAPFVEVCHDAQAE